MSRLWPVGGFGLSRRRRGRGWASLSAMAGIVVIAVLVAGAGPAAGITPICGDQLSLIAGPSVSPNSVVGWGQTLTTDGGQWCNAATRTYQWYRDGYQNGEGVPISGQTTNAYTLTSSDFNAAVNVRVTACDSANNCLTAGSSSVVTSDIPLGVHRRYSYAGQIRIDDQESLQVNVANGDLVLRANDFHLPGLAGFGLNFTRYYNSLYSSLSTFSNPTLAPGWEDVPDLAFFTGTADVRYTGESGYEVAFHFQNNAYSTPPGMDASLIHQGDGTYLLTFDATGVQQKFNSSGQLIDKIDRNGNTIAYTWSGGNIASISDTTGRTTSFTYNSSSQLTSITDAAGRTYHYGYDSSGHLTSYTDATGAVTTYGYNAAGLVSSVKNARNYEWQISYDAQNRVSLITGGLNSSGACPAGGVCPKTSFGYAGNHSFCGTPTTDVIAPDQYPSGSPESYCIDTRLRATAVQDPLGRITRTSYVPNGLGTGGTGCTQGSRPLNGPNWNITVDDRPCSTTDGLGNVTYYGWSGEDLLWQQNPLQTTTARSTWTYSAHQPTSFKDANGNTTAYGYTPAGNLASQTDALNRTTSYAYDSSGQLTSVTNPDSQATTYTYDSRGDLTSQTDPLGNETTYQYDSAGNRTSQVDPLGNVSGGNAASYTTAYTYDADGRLLSTTDQLNHTSTYTYDGAGNQSTATDANHHQTQYTYDANNRLLSLQDGLDANLNPVACDSGRTCPTTSWTYDANANLTAETTALGTTSYAYDADNELTSETDAVNNATHYTYDADGNRLTQVSSRNFTTNYTYSKTDQLTGQTDPLGDSTTYQYDLVGNLSSELGPTGSQTNYSYDADNRLSTLTSGLQYDASTHAYDCLSGSVCPSTSYVYNAEGEVTKVTDPNQNATTYSYYANGAPQTTTDPIGDATTDGYDANGDLLSKQTPNGTINYGYDYAGELTSITYNVTNPQTAPTPSVSYTYDAVGNRLTMTDGGPTGVSGSSTVTYQYDNRDQLTSVQRSGDSALAYGYDANGDVTSLTYPDGTTVSRTYFSNGELKNVVSGGATTAYAYDHDGNLSTTTLPSTTGYVETRTYDNADRPTEVKTAHGTSVLADFAYTLNGLGDPTQVARSGNVTGSVSCTTTYGYDNNERLNAATYQTGCPTNSGDASSFGWTFDGAGNRLTQNSTQYAVNSAGELCALAANCSAPTYTFDGNGNETQDGSSGRTYTYDLENRVVSTTCCGSNPVTTTYTYDGNGNRLTSSSGGVTTNYLWDTTTDGVPEDILNRSGTTGGTLVNRYVYGINRVSNTDSVGVHYYIYDGPGSVVNTISSSGAAEWAYTYEPYGAIRVATSYGSLTTNQMLFAAQSTDTSSADASLYNTGSNTYDASTGRYLSQTPPAAGTSPYVYADDAPVGLAVPAATAAVAAASATMATTSSSSSHPNYSSPFIHTPNAYYGEQIDDGVDFGVNFGGGYSTADISAIGKAVIPKGWNHACNCGYSSTGSGWYGNYLQYKLETGRHKGMYVYVAEHINVTVNKNVIASQAVHLYKGELIAKMFQGIETGWGSGLTDLTLAWKNGDSGGIPTTEGCSFGRFLKYIGTNTEVCS